MLKIEKTLQSVRDLLDRLGKEGVEFALVESEYSDYIADIRNPDKVYVFLTCSIRPNGTFVWRDYDNHKGVCDFDEFRVRIITLTADEYLDKAKDKRKQWDDLCDGADTPMPDSLAAVVSDMENKANRLRTLLNPDDPPLLDGRDIAILKELKPYGVVKPAEESQRLRDLGVLERRYYIDQVFDALTDKGEKALEFASHVGGSMPSCLTYEDWDDSSKDNHPQVGDYGVAIRENAYDQEEIPFHIEREEHTGLPVAVLNTQLYAKPEDDIEDGQYVSLFQLYLDGFELSRTGRKTDEDE